MIPPFLKNNISKKYSQNFVFLLYTIFLYLSKNLFFDIRCTSKFCTIFLFILIVYIVLSIKSFYVYLIFYWLIYNQISSLILYFLHNITPEYWHNYYKNDKSGYLLTPLFTRHSKKITNYIFRNLTHKKRQKNLP